MTDAYRAAPSAFSKDWFVLHPSPPPGSGHGFTPFDLVIARCEHYADDPDQPSAQTRATAIAAALNKTRPVEILPQG